MSDLLDKINSRYLLVNVVAKRSRNIAEEALEKCEPLDAKPVSIAVYQLAEGDYYAESKGEY